MELLVVNGLATSSQNDAVLTVVAMNDFVAHDRVLAIMPVDWHWQKGVRLGLALDTSLRPVFFNKEQVSMMQTRNQYFLLPY